MWFENISKGIQCVALTESWSLQALADGKVTLKEVVDLGTRLCEILGIPLEVEVSKTKKKEE